MQNAVVNNYLKLHEAMRAPQQYHVWSLLSAVAACAARRVTFRTGVVTTIPNMMIMLVGGPASAKSTTIRMAEALVSEVPGIRMTGSDTSGHKHGLFRLMREQDVGAIKTGSFAQLPTMTFGADDMDAVVTAQTVRDGEENAVWACVSEGATFFGQHMTDMLMTLGHLFDGDPYVYTTKSDVIRIDKPCINILTGMTPASMPVVFPGNATDIGVMSRAVFVWGEPKANIKLWADEVDQDLAPFKQIMLRVHGMSGPLSHTPALKNAFEELVTQKSNVSDVRFAYYNERRVMHIIKVAMNLCMLRGSTVIDVVDFEDALELLSATEVNMPECLGMYGLTPYEQAKARVTQLLKAEARPLTPAEVITRASASKPSDVYAALNALVGEERVTLLQAVDPHGRHDMTYMWKIKRQPALMGDNIEELPPPIPRIAVAFTDEDKAHGRAQLRLAAEKDKSLFERMRAQLARK